MAYLLISMETLQLLPQIQRGKLQFLMLALYQQQ